MDMAPASTPLPAMAAAAESSAVPVDLLEILGQTVRRHPDKIAVEAREGKLSYDQIDRLSNQIAHRLLALGVGRESRVGLSLPRGALELCALLGTVKAGGTYVPLDPTHPLERLQMIIEDAAPEVVLVSVDSRLGGTRAVVLDSLAEATAGQPQDPPHLAASPEQLAYLLFTSGSTGRPKGVEITRGALTNFLRSMAHTPGLHPDERLLAITTTSFDIAGLELLLPLWVGATVVIADAATTHDPRRLLRTLEQERIDVMQATPATWRLLLEAGWRGDHKLRMLCGGEAMSPALADRLLRAGGELWNMYGPTETTVWSTLGKIEAGYDQITIGKPIDNTQVYVLDENLRPVPVGAEGELWIGGAGLARGYRGRPQLTSERFVPSPFGAVGERLYRTGDLGRQLPDGRLVCLGRLDNQVKIRGFRIELGEIETVLRNVPGVNEALVVADRNSEENTRLIAYWVGEAKTAELVKAAERSLPSYMIPAAYIPLPAFPLSSNGKIDRKALPEPNGVVTSQEQVGRPATAIEKRVAEVFRQVLGLTEIPLEQSFFTLGGTSEMALRVVARVERELGIAFSMQAFYDAPSVAGVAQNAGKEFSPDAPIIARLREGKPGQAPLFCLFGVTLYQDLALRLTQDRPVFGIHIPFRFVPGKDRRPDLHQIGARYAETIRGLQERGPYHLLGLCFGGVAAYETARQLQLAGQEVAMVTIIDAVLPHGLRVNRAAQVYGLLRKAWQTPEELAKALRKQLASRVGVAWGRLRRLLANGRTSPTPTAELDLIDLPVEGPEADAEVTRFATVPRRLSTRVLVVCAGAEPWPSYVRVAPDQGWNGWADSVVVRRLPADHLGVLREPHVRLLAEALAEVAPAQPEPSAAVAAGL